MASDGTNFGRVAPGQRLRIRAKTWNAMLGAAEYVAGIKNSGGDRGGADLPFGNCLVRNIAGTDAPRMGVLTISAPMVVPSHNEDAFARRLILDGDLPAANDRHVAILLASAGEDQVVPAIVTGLACVTLTVLDEAHEFAATAAGVTDSLYSAPRGPARIIWKEPEEDRETSSIARAIVCLGQANRPGETFAVTCTIDGGSAGTSSATCSFTYTVKDLHGVSIGMTKTPERRRFPNTPYTTTPENAPGLAYFGLDGALHLLDANELPDTELEC